MKPIWVPEIHRRGFIMEDSRDVAIKKLIDALLFYAKRENYQIGEEHYTVFDDNGQHARTVLKELEIED